MGYFKRKIKKAAIICMAFLVVGVLIATPGLWAATKVSAFFNGIGSFFEGIGTGSYEASSGKYACTQSSETAILNGVASSMTSEQRADMHLQNVSLEDLVMLTMNPDGELPSDEKGASDVSFNLEYKELHKFYPTSDEIADYRNSLQGEALAQKIAAEIAVAERAHDFYEAKIKARNPDAEVPDFDMEQIANSVSLTAEETAAIEEDVQKWVDENTYTDYMYPVYTHVLSGEQKRLYLNSFHTPWQANYGLAEMIELYCAHTTGNYSSDVGLSISKETLALVKKYYLSQIQIQLKQDYWADEWDIFDVSFSSYASVFTSPKGEACYSEWDYDYSNNPIVVSDGEAILRQWGYAPQVLLDYTDLWAVRTEYSAETIGENEWGYGNQVITKESMSNVFKRIKSEYGFLDSDCAIMSSIIANLTEGDMVSLDFDKACKFARSSQGTGYLIEQESIDWLDASTYGGRVSLTALSRLGDIYSMPLRDTEGHFDCSSFACWVYKQQGVNIAYKGDNTAAGEAYACKQAGCVISSIYDESVMQPGDLIFWDHSSRRDNDGAYLKIDHVGVYIGNGIIVDASSTWGHVVVREMWGEMEVVCVARPQIGQF